MLADRRERVAMVVKMVVKNRRGDLHKLGSGFTGPPVAERDDVSEDFTPTPADPPERPWTIATGTQSGTQSPGSHAMESLSIPSDSYGKAAVNLQW